jgi:hypothetical protein
MLPANKSSRARKCESGLTENVFLDLGPLGRRWRLLPPRIIGRGMNLAIVASQLSSQTNSFLALRQRTRLEFTVFTFFLHAPYKIADVSRAIALQAA